jgi:hypothetical protein
MAEKVMFVGMQALSTRGVKASPLTTHGFGPSRAVTEKKTKHHDELTNAKLIPYILLEYIPPLAGTVSHDNVPRDFDYTFIPVYLPKDIRLVRP